MLAATTVDFSNFSPSYKCGATLAPTICYGVGSQTDSLFRSIQTLINYFAPVAGFQALTIDGKLGPDTVAAAQAAARQLLQNANTSPFGNNLMGFASSKEALAQNAVAVQQTLQSGITTLSLKPVPAPSTKELVPGTSTTPPVALPPLPMAGGSWKPWLIGAGVLAVLGGAAWYFYSEG